MLRIRERELEGRELATDQLSALKAPDLKP